MLRSIVLLGCLLSTGCSMLPRVAHEPAAHNPFPQLSKVAVAPFFNLSQEPTVDGREVAVAYYNELQLVPGFEVVPVGVVETAMRTHNIQLSGPAEARRLAQILEVDAMVVGAVTDFTPYYPPRCGLQVEWYAANPAFHPIPPGYGLPWGTPDEKDIPAPVVFEAEMALAREQLKTQTPNCERPSAPDAGSSESGIAAPEVGPWVSPEPTPDGLAAESIAGLPAGWPDPRGFIPPPPAIQPPPCWTSDEPVMRHTRIYNGHDTEFTEALADYYLLHDDARFGGWQAYLQRSDDFVRFCCHQHILEMLGARGGADETRVVWQWPTIR